MILILTLCILLALVFYGWKISQDIFAPFVITPLVWAFVLFCFLVFPHNLYPIGEKFAGNLLVWVISFFLSSLVAYQRTSMTSEAAVQVMPNKKVINLYVTLTIILMPIVIVVTIWTAFINDPVNMFRYLRVMNTGVDESIEAPDLGILNYMVAMAYVTLFFTLLYVKNKWILGTIIFLNLMLAFITMAKTTFLCVILSSLYVLYVKEIIKIRHITYGLLFFVLLSLTLQSLRAASSQDEVVAVDSFDFFILYILTPIPAFEHFALPFSAVHWGENTFRLFYAIFYALGSDIAPVKTILEFVYVPVETNTYTVLYPFYKDFGTFGVFFFSAVYGLFYGYLYKKTITGSKFALIVYAMLLNYIILQFIGDFIFTNLSMEVQHVFFALLPFLKFKYNGQKSRYIDGHV